MSVVVLPAPAPLQPRVDAVSSCCPTAARPVDATFIALWRQQVDRPYACANGDALALLILNREVAALCGGREGEDYAETAGLNVTRLLARLGADLPAHAREQMRAFDKDEVEFLSWCQARTQHLSGREVLERWSPSTDTWTVVRDVCVHVCVLDPVRAASALGNLEPHGIVNFPLGYARRLLRLEVARRCLSDGAPAQARAHADLAGPDGERISYAALAAEGHIALNERTDYTNHARYRSYVAKREARRLAGVGFVWASQHWLAESDAWSELASKLTGDPDQ